MNHWINGNTRFLNFNPTETATVANGINPMTRNSFSYSLPTGSHMFEILTNTHRTYWHNNWSRFIRRHLHRLWLLGLEGEGKGTVPRYGAILGHARTSPITFYSARRVRGYDILFLCFCPKHCRFLAQMIGRFGLLYSNWSGTRLQKRAA